MVGTTIPPFAFMLLVTMFYEKIVNNIYVSYFMAGMQSAVTALLLYVTVDTFRLNRKNCDIYGYILMVISFIYAMFTDYSLLYLFIFVVIATYIRTILLTRHFR